MRGMRNFPVIKVRKIEPQIPHFIFKFELLMFFFFLNGRKYFSLGSKVPFPLKNVTIVQQVQKVACNEFSNFHRC